MAKARQHVTNEDIIEAARKEFRRYGFRCDLTLDWRERLSGLQRISFGPEPATGQAGFLIDTICCGISWVMSDTSKLFDFHGWLVSPAESIDPTLRVAYEHPDGSSNGWSRDYMTIIDTFSLVDVISALVPYSVWRSARNEMSRRAFIDECRKSKGESGGP